jgi:dTDP-4-dehydrorhamnose 3,5-epimerase
LIYRKTPLDGSYLIELELNQDDRGFFARYFCEKEFSSRGLNTRWVQINNSMSQCTGTLRGLHFQRPPNAEVKLIRCIAGAIWDVVVDLRADSETYGKWFGATLSSENRTMMYVPEGFAHGFISLAPNSEILYLVSEFYTPSAEETVAWNDETIGIYWPIPAKIISERDKSGIKLRDLG